MAQTAGASIQLSRVLPTLFELISLLFLTFFVVLIGNTKNMIEYYGLGSSQDILQHSTTSAINIGLSKLDGFSITAKIVTFLVWAVIGVLCFSIVQVIGRAYHEFEEQGKVSSNSYIHPSTFARAAFWWEVVVHFFRTLICIAFLGVGLYVLLGYVLPVSLTFTRLFLTGVSLSHLGSFLLGCVMLYSWIFVLTVIVKITVNRNRLRAS